MKYLSLSLGSTLAACATTQVEDPSKGLAEEEGFLYLSFTCGGIASPSSASLFKIALTLNHHGVADRNLFFDVSDKAVFIGIILVRGLL